MILDKDLLKDLEVPNKNYNKGIYSSSNNDEYVLIVKNLINFFDNYMETKDYTNSENINNINNNVINNIILS